MSRYNVYSFRLDNNEFSPHPIVCPSVYDLFVALAESYERGFVHRDKLRTEPVVKIAEFDPEKGIFYNCDTHDVIISSDQFKHLFSLDSMSDGLDLLLSAFGTLIEGAAVGENPPQVAEPIRPVEDVPADELKDWE